jgi:alkanesulfonate monooxygenase SsuD/methylene tetrahydromethanopterin reductase-like flavin-dependent oxidoreductase (luciferase family)
MRFAIWPGPNQPYEAVLETARHADRTGWDGVYFADHFMMNTDDLTSPGVATLEATSVLSALAVSTEHVRLGPLVLGNTYRHPAVVANWAASLDQVSGGRFVLGIGAGWQRNEHHEYGIDLPGPGELVSRFGEACAVMAGLLSQPRTDFEGEHYRLVDAECEPKPVQDPLPILVGGKGNRMLGIIARHAQEWNMWASPETLTERGAGLDRRCEAVGRDPSTVGRSVQAIVHVTDDESAATALIEAVAPRPVMAGPPERFGEMVAEWAAAGATEVVVPDFAMSKGARRLEEMDALLAAGRDAAT